MHQVEPLALYLLNHDAQYLLLPDRILGQEHQSRAVVSLLGHGYSLQEDKFMRYLQHDAGTVAGFSVCALSPSVPHVLQHLQRTVHQFVALVSPDVHHHTHTTSVMLVFGVV